MKTLLLPEVRGLSPKEVVDLLPQVVVIDSRDNANDEYIPGSVNIPL